MNSGPNQGTGEHRQNSDSGQRSSDCCARMDYAAPDASRQRRRRNPRQGMSEPTQPATVAAPTVAIATTCPRCGSAMSLPLEDGCDRADALRLSKLVLCNSCSPDWHGARVRPTGHTRHSTPHAAPQRAGYRAPPTPDAMNLSSTGQPAHRQGYRGGTRHPPHYESYQAPRYMTGLPNR